MNNGKLLMIYPAHVDFRERALPLGFYLASSIFSKNNFNVRCIDLALEKNWEEKIKNTLIEFEPDYIGLSICSASNYIFALKIIPIIKSIDENIPITLGGQHMRPPMTSENMGFNICFDYAEFLKSFNGCEIESSRIETLDYSLVENIEAYIPTVEISRGCWEKCSFCNAENFFFKKDIKSIEKEFLNLVDLYPTGTVLSLGGSNHIFKHWKKSGLLDLLNDYSQHFKYTFNIGVNTDWDVTWDSIVKMEPWNLYIGLESVSPSTLIRMRKTKKTDKYIKKAYDILDRCKADGIYALITYIYGYPGDTTEDLDILENFITENISDTIVQCGGPCLAYPGSEVLAEKEKHEANGVVFNRFYDKSIDNSFYQLDISKDLTYDYLNKKSSDIFRNANINRESYYRCRGIRNFATYDEFTKNTFFFMRDFIN